MSSNPATSKAKPGWEVLMKVNAGQVHCLVGFLIFNFDVERHIGQIVEKNIRTKGINLTELAEGINVSRSSLYSYFRKHDLDAHIVLKIGQAIDYDFSTDLPELLLEIKIPRRPGLELLHMDSNTKINTLNCCLNIMPYLKADCLTR